LSIGSFTQDNFINILDKEARKSAENCLKTGADTIIVLDNYSIHKSPNCSRQLHFKLNSKCCGIANGEV
jgi:hypothetical protein